MVQFENDKLRSEAASKPSPAKGLSGAQPDQALAGIHLAVKGFTDVERRLLQASVLLSRRRAPRIDLVPEGAEESADVVMIDAQDPAALRWAGEQGALHNQPAIFVDGDQPLHASHLQLRRPVQWAILPMLLFRALEQAAPKESLSAAPPARTLRRASDPSVMRRVMIVDDSLAIREYVRSLLEPEGFQVIEAKTGEEGVALADSEPLEVVLMDVLMPGMDGFEACRRIKTGVHARTPPAVVMLTSKASPFNRVRGKMANCDEYLTKPVDPPQLFSVVNDLCRAMRH